MNAGIAFISRKSRKADVAWRYAIALGRWRGVGVMFDVSAVIGRWRNRHEHRGLIVGQNRLQFLVRVFLDTAFEQIRSAGMMYFEHLPQQFVDLGNIGRRGPTNHHVIHLIQSDRAVSTGR